MDLNARFIQPMREELTAIGFQELTTPAAVDAALGPKQGAVLVFVELGLRLRGRDGPPGVAQALEAASVRPDQLVTVFAGQDREATARAREFFTEYPPSSPSIALLKDGAPVAFIARHHIEGRSAEAVAALIKGALETHCGAATA